MLKHPKELNTTFPNEKPWERARFWRGRSRVHSGICQVWDSWKISRSHLKQRIRYMIWILKGEVCLLDSKSHRHRWAGLRGEHIRREGPKMEPQRTSPCTRGATEEGRKRARAIRRDQERVVSWIHEKKEGSFMLNAQRGRKDEGIDTHRVWQHGDHQGL